MSALTSAISSTVLPISHCLLIPMSCFSRMLISCTRNPSGGGRSGAPREVLFKSLNAKPLCGVGGSYWLLVWNIIILNPRSIVGLMLHGANVCCVSRSTPFPRSWMTLAQRHGSINIVCSLGGVALGVCLWDKRIQAKLGGNKSRWSECSLDHRGWQFGQGGQDATHTVGRVCPAAPPTQCQWRRGSVHLNGTVAVETGPSHIYRGSC